MFKALTTFFFYVMDWLFDTLLTLFDKYDIFFGINFDDER